MSLNPPGLMYRMGEAYFTLGKYDAAKRWLESLVAAYPDDVAKAWERGRV